MQNAPKQHVMDNLADLQNDVKRLLELLPDLPPTATAVRLDTTAQFLRTRLNKLEHDLLEDS